jgi:hypothetical protein
MRKVAVATGRRHLLQIGNNPIQKKDAHADDNEKRDIELHRPSDTICTLVLLSQDNYSSYALWSRRIPHDSAFDRTDGLFSSPN